MQRRCESCGKSYEAARKTSKYCGGTCRVRASRGALAPAVSPLAALPDPSPDTGLVAMVEKELRDAGRLDTFLGQAAVALARRIVADQDTGSAIASLNREMRATVADAVKGASVARSAVDRRKDELAARRRA